MTGARVLWLGEWTGCWLAGLPGAGPCDGPLIRAHLIPRQVIRREFVSARRHVTGGGGLPIPLKAELARLVDDERCWVPACGGASGVGGHHGMLDFARTLRIPRAALPPALEELAAELELGWWLDREYGPRAVAA